MKPLSIIKSNPTFKKGMPSLPHIDVAEFFCDTIQGEGIYTGQPAAFLRVQHCTMACTWCDTQEVWHYGNPYTMEEIFELMDQVDLPRKLSEGQHLVFTGGSPLKQQDRLIVFINEFIKVYGFKPFIEVENECAVIPLPAFVKRVDCWNNSPKLSNSGNLQLIRYQPNILQHMSSLSNSWFKFVISAQEDWNEIQKDFLDTGLLRKEQVILMPLGGSRQELEENREGVVEIAVNNNVRYSTREHVVLWDILTGV